MENHVSIIGIIVENLDSTDRLNELLHEYGSYIIGRMGLPYQKKNVNIISIALDAPSDVIFRFLVRIIFFFFLTEALRFPHIFLNRQEKSVRSFTEKRYLSGD